MGLSILAGTSLGSAVGLALLLLVARLTSPPMERAAAPPVPDLRPQPARASPGSGLPAPSQPAATGRSDRSTRDPLLAGLTTVLEEETESVDATVALHVRLHDGRHGGLNAGESAPAAGLARLPLAAAVFAAWEGGFLRRTPADADRLRTMLSRGDLKAADELLDRLGRSPATEWLNNHGFPGTRFGRSFGEPPERGEIVTTPADMTRLLMGAARDDLVSTEGSREMRRLMSEETRRLVLASVGPAGSRTTGLRGADDRVYNEAVVIERAGEGPVAICIMISGGEGPGERAALVVRLYRRVQDWLRSHAGAAVRPTTAAAPASRAF
jgi:hypothetical protein